MDLKPKLTIVLITLLFLSVICIYSSCLKTEITTEVKGVVVNDATGLPMQNVATWIIAYGNGSSPSDTAITNSNGEYILSVKSGIHVQIEMYAYKNGYTFYTYKNVPPNTSTFKNINLSPIDSYIKFKIINKFDYSEFSYGTYWSKTLEHQFMSSIYYPIIIPLNSVYEETRPCTGNNYINVTWDYSEFNSSYLFPHLDSIYVNRGDTAVYIITM